MPHDTCYLYGGEGGGPIRSRLLAKGKCRKINFRRQKTVIRFRFEGVCQS